MDDSGIAITSVLLEMQTHKSSKAATLVLDLPIIG